ncbi:MAG: nitroreductase family protein [Coriobacteriales bacterium]|jgi:nitroreductase|nr:nitroreductase family protein [Coriobacteriales bacterium]
MKDFATLIQERYSTRSFKPDAIDADKVAVLLEAARVAPTAHNNQPQRIKVLSSQAELALVDEFTPCRFGAPLVFVVSFDKQTAWKRPFDGVDSGVVDSSIVTTHLMLQAADIGLASVWVMYFDAVKASELLGLADGLLPVAVLPVGYPADDAKPSPFHAERVPVFDLLI